MLANQQAKLEELEYGRIISVMNQVADVEFNDARWLQSAGDFQCFLNFLSNVSSRSRIFHDFQNTNLSMDAQVELIRKLALANMQQVSGSLHSIPERFRQDSWKHAIESLSDAVKQLNDLTLSVCFIGPAKSGKSTSISSLLGCKLLPSDTFPCTVIPTVVRHVPCKGVRAAEVALLLPDVLLQTVEAIIGNFKDLRNELNQIA